MLFRKRFVILFHKKKEKGGTGYGHKEEKKGKDL